MGEKLSEVEAELYDRQIRLWGIESQERLRASNVLLIGVRGLGSEIAKNLLLSGINSLTIVDNLLVTQEEQRRNFLIDRDGVGKSMAEAVLAKAQALNPLVKIVVDGSDPADLDAAYYEQFTIIVATGIKSDLVLKLDRICRSAHVKLIFGDVFGSFGYSVADFQQHDYYEDQVKLAGKKRHRDGTETKPPKETVKIRGQINYPELAKVIVLPNAKQSVDHIKRVRKRNEYFFLMLVLLEFRNRFDRNPELRRKNDDVEQLARIRNDVLDLYGIDRAKLHDDLFELVFDEVVPVCAVLGGVVAQEAIKGVSQKEVPINNVFLFDPITYCGKEETIA